MNQYRGKPTRVTITSSFTTYDSSPIPSIRAMTGQHAATAVRDVLMRRGLSDVEVQVGDVERIAPPPVEVKGTYNTLRVQKDFGRTTTFQVKGPDIDGSNLVSIDPKDLRKVHEHIGQILEVVD